MYIGTGMGYVGAVGNQRDHLNYAVDAERLGYDSIWVGEPYGHDAVTILAACAVVTERIVVGSGIMAIPGRTAAMCGQTAATLDWLSNGRFHLGLGTSGPQISEGWHGVPYDRQLTRTREYIDVVRKVMLREEPLTYDGKTIKLPPPGRTARPVKLILHPVRAKVPISLAALGPRNVELCGEIADGWQPWMYAPEHAAALRAPLEIGSARAGRPSSEIEIIAPVTTFIGDDLDGARDHVRPIVALYVGGMGTREQNFYNRVVRSYGWEEEAALIQDLYLAGKISDAIAAVPDDLIDLVCLVGPVDRVADRLVAYAEAGVNTLVAGANASHVEVRTQQLHLFAEAAARSGVVTLR